ncbi:MAG: ferric-dicitrate binding protein FerR (iron transport regulator) [Myxococcota bacterium]|jgi:ferric-dicitrate binding protein FerR (iron transport regulator)
MSREHNDAPLGQDYGWELEQLRAETQARAAEVAAVRMRLRTTLATPPPTTLRWSLGLGAGIGALAAAAALFLVLQPAPAPQQLDLVSTEWTSEQVHQDVQLSFEGRGQLEATGRSHAITWREGRLKVSVRPKQDIQLDVHTPEATVSVVGTIFQVDRDLTGTTVSVERGHVAVRCGDGPTRSLLAGDDGIFCQTTSPTGLAALTRQQREAGDLDGALATSAAGLAATTPDSYVAAELHWHRALIFTRQADWPAAQASAEALLTTGQDSFLTDAHHAAALAGRMSSGCASAEPHLRWLAEASGASPTELAQLADCTAPDAPDEARRWLQAALEGAEDASLREQLTQRLDQLER